MPGWRWAHPRSRGENGWHLAALAGGAGSSPLTRGKPDEYSPLHIKVGLIPAHAGKTPARRGFAPSGRAHPRSRGENTSCSQPCGTVRGSSPLTRGKRDLSEVTRGSQGLIPAHAGKTTVGAPANRSPRAHPRSRGENAVSIDHAV